MRTFVIGDIHGAHKALVQCLERSKFDWDNDLLITLGDICDGWSEVYECVQLLLQIKNTINIVGNHDVWFQVFLDTGIHGDVLGPWHQGGHGTATSYLRRIGMQHMIQRKPHQYGYVTTLNPADIPGTHWRFFKHQHLYYVDELHRCYVHGGFLREKTMSENRVWAYNFYEDRKLWYKAMCCKGAVKLKTKEKFSEIFLGHTSTATWDLDTPMHAGGVWNLDTGAGRNGKLTIMDVDTKEFWQSDLVQSLYAEEAKSSSEKI